MKRIFIAFIMLSAGVCTITAKPKDVKSAYTITPASDSRITFVGRTSVKGENVSFDWSGVYARIDFNGKYVALKAGDTRKDYFNVWLDTPTDCRPDKVIRISSADTTIILFDKADFVAKYGKADRKGTQRHEVIIQKRTEGEQGTATFKSVITEGSVLQAEKLKKRQIEFIGDSYTCGYGTEAKAGEHFTPETENVNYSYAPIISRYFDADCYIMAHSGMGIARNYNDKVKGYYMPDRYLHTFDTKTDFKWNADSSDFKPAITVILLGTNDFSRSRQPSLKSFVKNYIRLIREIKKNYGADYPVLCLKARGDNVLFEYIRTACETCGMTNVHYMGYGDAVYSSKELGADSHPNYYAQRKTAMGAIPYISTLTGWPIKDSPVK